MPYLQKQVDFLVATCRGDQFLACNVLSRKSERVMEQAKGCLSDAESHVCALTNQVRVDLKERARQRMNITVPGIRRVERVLSYVDDEGICECVRKSFEQSCRIGSLTFYYPVKLSEYQKSRVRVITRMCWYGKEGAR